LGLGVIAVDAFLGLSGRTSFLAASLAAAGVLLSTGRSWDRRLAAVSAVSVGAAVLLLEHAASLWPLVAAGCLAPGVACVEAVAYLARVPRSREVLPPTLTSLRLSWVISAAIGCVMLMVVASLSEATTRMAFASQLRLVSAVGWLLLPVALIVPWLARLSGTSDSARRSALLVGAAAGIAGVAGLIDGSAPMRVVIGASVGAVLGWFGTGTGQRDMPEELPLEWSSFIHLAIKYSALVAVLLGCVVLLATIT
jgi:hypothetical protein